MTMMTQGTALIIAFVVINVLAKTTMDRLANRNRTNEKPLSLSKPTVKHLVIYHRYSGSI